MDVKRSLRGRILLATLTNGISNCIQAIEMSCLKGTYEMTAWDGNSNKSICERLNMGMCANVLVKYVKINTLRWFGQTEKNLSLRKK